jgi:putative addiction module killer protein
MAMRSIIYKTDTGREPYCDYVDKLKDRKGAAKIRLRASRAEMGNLGKHRSLGDGMIELKIDFGPGYRIYAGLPGEKYIVLLGAGDKSSQQKDIAKAKAYWKEFRRTA